MIRQIVVFSLFLSLFITIMLYFNNRVAIHEASERSTIRENLK